MRINAKAVMALISVMAGGVCAADFSDLQAMKSTDINIAIPDNPQPKGWFPGLPGQPGQQPPQGGHPAQPPQPPAPVDTSNAYNAGMRDGSDKGVREGRREGYADGLNSGEKNGGWHGYNDGDNEGRAAGYRDGYGVDQSAGTLQGNADGQSAGINNGTAAGKRRCYDEGYTSGYNVAFAEAKKLGEQDAASYSAGYAKGQADAATIEAGNGQKAGYQAGFSQREAELQSSFTGTKALRGASAKSVLGAPDLPIKLVRYGYATPEEGQAYERGYSEGYQRSYRRAYEDAKREGYSESYDIAYRRAYDAQFSVGYRAGYSDGKDKGYRDAYDSAYNSAYNQYYDTYSRMDYPEQRVQGLSSGQATGKNDGFAAGCAEQTKLGYKDGYEKMAAEVYPGAFSAGKQAGIAAADKYYSENAVLKVVGMALYDENNNGKFEASENVMMKAEVMNFGFQKSDAVAIVAKSERGEITLAPELRAEGVGSRAKTVVTLNLGKLYDVVAPDADALNVTFSEKGQLVGDFRQMYTRTNDNKVGVVAKDDTAVAKRPNWIVPGNVATLSHGEKVIITGQDGGFYKVRKSAVKAGNWTEGYMDKTDLALQ